MARRKRGKERFEYFRGLSSSFTTQGPSPNGQLRITSVKSLLLKGNDTVVHVGFVLHGYVKKQVVEMEICVTLCWAEEQYGQRLLYLSPGFIVCLFSFHILLIL